jgi:hypothetical protein
MKRGTGLTMTPAISVSRKDVSQIIAATFPDYRKGLGAARRLSHA